jgi:hypothetical protein
VLVFQFYLTLLILAIVSISTQNKGFNKGHIEVYRASVDELLQFHQLKRNFNHFDKLYLKAQFFLDFLCMNAIQTSVSSLFLVSNPGMLHFITLARDL